MRGGRVSSRRGVKKKVSSARAATHPLPSNGSIQLLLARQAHAPARLFIYDLDALDLQEGREGLVLLLVNLPKLKHLRRLALCGAALHCQGEEAPAARDAHSHLFHVRVGQHHDGLVDEDERLLQGVQHAR